MKINQKCELTLTVTPVVPKESKKQRAPRMDRNAREATLERAQRLSLNQLVKDEEVMD